MLHVSVITKKAVICILSALLICSLSACKGNKGKNTDSEGEIISTEIEYERDKGYTEEEAAEMAEEGCEYFVKSGDMFYPLAYANEMWHDSDYDWESGYMTPEGSEPIDPATIHRDIGDELVYFHSQDDPGSNFFVTRLTDMNFTIPLQFIEYEDEDTGERSYHCGGFDIDDVAHVYSETDDDELEIPLDRIKEINDRTIENLCESPEVESITGDQLYDYSPSDQSYDEYVNGGKDEEGSLYDLNYKGMEIFLLKCDQNDKVKVLYQDGAEDREIMLRAKTKAYFTYEKDINVFAGEEDTGTYQTIDTSDLSVGTYSIRTIDRGGNIFWIEE